MGSPISRLQRRRLRRYGRSRAFSPSRCSRSALSAQAFSPFRCLLAAPHTRSARLLAGGLAWLRNPRAPAFYWSIAAATFVGAGLNFTPLDPIKALFWSAVINGVVAVPIMAMIMMGFKVKGHEAVYD
jgi:hypothetical protein